MPSVCRPFDLERREARTTELMRSILGLGRSRYESTLRILGNAALLIGILALASPSTAQTCSAPLQIACNETWLGTTDCVSNEGSYSCNAFSYPGGDDVWELASSPGQELWIDLIPQSAGSYDLDLFLQTGTCGPGGTCEGFSDNAGTLTSEQIPGFIADGSNYLISVDDAAGFCLVDYVVQVGCPQPCSVPSDIQAELTCSSDLPSQTTAAGTDALDYYSCGTPNGPLLQPEEENIYDFTPQATGTVTVFIDNMTTDHDLYVLDSVCDQASCIAGANDSGLSESVSFFAVAGNTYFIVVEAPAGVGNFDLHVLDNTGGCQEDCDDLIDNDFDGDTDCDDTDCTDDPVCLPEPSAILTLAASIAFLATLGRRRIQV